jgi:phosphomannomutase
MQNAKCKLAESNPQSLIPNPSVLLAGDGRPLTAELVAAAIEGLRSIGCDVVDLGPSTSACLAFAVRHLNAAGGILIGNPESASHTVGMKFWVAGPRPLSAGGSLEPIIQRYESGVMPAVRKYGQLQRFQADGPYLSEMSKLYHALRPLRIVIDSASKPTVDFLQRLTATVACEIIPSRNTRDELPRQVRDDRAHFAACIDGDAETCRLLDEQGREIPPERLLLLLAVGDETFRPGAGKSTNDVPLLRRSSADDRGPLQSTACKQTVAHADKEHVLSAETIVLETETSPSLVDRLRQVGLRIVMSSPRRADMSAAMQAHAAMLGGGPNGRFWHSELGPPLCDAVLTVTLLLRRLSRGDEPLSALLDRDAPLM